MSSIDLKAVGRGALAGLLLIVPLSALRAILDREIHDFDSSGWVPLFAIALFGAYVVAGVVAGRRAEDAPMSNGLLAGVGRGRALAPAADPDLDRAQRVRRPLLRVGPGVHRGPDLRLSCCSPRSSG